MTYHELIGHLSFGLTAISWAYRSPLQLRLFAIASLALSLWFNYALASGPLWQVIGWISVFLVINVVQVVVLLRGNSEITLTNRHQAIRTAAWPQMRSRDFMRMIKACEMQTLPAGAQLLHIGDHTDGLMLVADGWLDEDRDDGTHYRLGVGSTIGGATFIARDDLGGSPSAVRAGSQGATILKWSYEQLYSFIEKHPRMGAPLYEGITRGMIVKYRMLREHESAPITSFRPVQGSLLPASVPMHSS